MKELFAKAGQLVEKECQHSYGFIFDYRGESGYVGVWRCTCCRFYLNFDPEKYPQGVAFIRDKDVKQGKTVKILSSGF